MQINNAGTLYIVATPIGNLGDITLRALETLKTVDIIACENRNHHLKLLNHYEIKKRLIEYSPANEANSANGIIKLLEEGKNIALVSDAGTPTISDPGSLLVRLAVDRCINVVPVPGVSSFATIMSVSGATDLPSIFLGFLKKSGGKQKKELSIFKDTSCVIVFFSNGKRIKLTLGIVNEIFPSSEVIIGREMTKMNEEFLRGNPVLLTDIEFEERGEFTIAVINRI